MNTDFEEADLVVVPPTKEKPCSQGKAVLAQEQAKVLLNSFPPEQVSCQANLLVMYVKY